MNIVIVESPSKANTIEKYLGENFRVLSSVGHIRDLAISGVGGLGLDIENGFQPKYSNIKGKDKVIKELKKACKDADIVYLATDPDREGEAISWHIYDALGLTEERTERVVFNEITKKAVLEAIQNPRKINMDLVESQETRRILDRIIGFKLSNLLQRKISSKSAGRVQSVALKLIVDLEDRIQAFIPEEYWDLFVDFEERAKLVKYKGKKINITNEDEMNVVLNALEEEFTVNSVKTTLKAKSSRPPFITSTLQQDASNKLNFGAKKTMMVAQKLYEGIEVGGEVIGLITYMRTDSTRLSDEFVSDSKSHIEVEFGKEYYKGYSYKKGKNAQDAHEAIRPTRARFTPESIQNYLSKDEYKLYNLIYSRAVASLMSDAKYDETKIELVNNDYLFTMSGKTLKFDGYTKVYKFEETLEKQLPVYNEGETVKGKLDPLQKFTKPPKRFTEASLIKKMEELGIGRPSTYAQTMDTLKKRNYVGIEEKKFTPTKQGILTTKKLDEFFNQVINVDYTVKMEENLDKIAGGEEHGKNTVGDFYYEFIPMVEEAYEKMEKLAPEKVGRPCPECGHELVKRNGRYGEFVACENFPECKYIEKQKKEVISTGVKCPVCETGEMVERTATRGRNKGKKFYACNNFPKCKHIVNEKPIKEHCPECSNLLLETENGIVCSQKECEYNKKDS